MKRQRIEKDICLEDEPKEKSLSSELQSTSYPQVTSIKPEYRVGATSTKSFESLESRKSDFENGVSFTTIYVGHLHPKLTQTHIEKMFSKYGEVVRINLLANRGYGFCEMARPEQAAAAMTALHGQSLLGRPLTVRPANDKQSGTVSSLRGSTGPSGRNLSTQQQTRQIDSRIQAIKRKLEESKK
jgi:RNA recognition motif-containing protein